jgi:hypothetical protein
MSKSMLKVLGRIAIACFSAMSAHGFAQTIFPDKALTIDCPLSGRW